MNAIDDTGEDDAPGLPPPQDVWLAERRVLAAAAVLRDTEEAEASSDARRAALLDYRTAWLRFMVSLCNLPLADRPEAVEHVMEALREAHLLRPPGELNGPMGPMLPPSPLDVPPEVSHE